MAVDERTRVVILPIIARRMKRPGAPDIVQETPNFLGVSPKGFSRAEIMVNYHDVAKVRVTGTEKAVSELDAASDEWVRVHWNGPQAPELQPAQVDLTAVERKPGEPDAGADVPDDPPNEERPDTREVEHGGPIGGPADRA